MTEILDEQGHYTIPWFVGLTIFDDQTECWVVAQNPPGGTVVTGTQTIMVCLQYTCGNNEDEYASLPIELKDVTPPEVNLFVDSTSEPHLSFGGVVRYLTPVVVAPIVTVSDAADANPSKQITLDGQPYQLGMTVSTVGLHFLNVHTVDASDNSKDMSAMFEVRERPSHTAAAVVESTSCEFSPDGMTGTLHATLLLSAATFDHLHMLPSSVRVLLRNADGTYANSTPIPIKGGVVPECYSFQDHLAVMDINLCRVRFEIQTQFPAQTPNQCPAQFVIVGAGVSNGALTVEWGAATANIADPTPEQTLLALVNKAAPCGTPQPPPPPPACSAVETFYMNTNNCVILPTPAGPPCAGGGSSASAKANSGVTGTSTAVANAGPFATCGPIAAPCGPISGGAVLIVQFLGNCCNCSVTYTANASVSPSSLVTGSNSYNGTAVAFGLIRVTTPCGIAAVQKITTLTCGDNFHDPMCPTLALVGFMTPVNCTVPGCGTSMMFIQTEVAVSASAQAIGGILGSTCSAKATVNSNPAYNAFPTFSSNCPPEECPPP